MRDGDCQGKHLGKGACHKGKLRKSTPRYYTSGESRPKKLVLGRGDTEMTLQKGSKIKKIFPTPERRRQFNHIRKRSDGARKIGQKKGDQEFASSNEKTLIE